MLDTQQQPNQTETKLHDWNIIPKSERTECDEAKPNDIGRKKLKQGPDPITWTVSDLAKAGCLLHSPPIGTAFEDEQEMRRVYTLIYDVFRYKNVLMQALNDINFFQIFEQLQAYVPIIWLLFYDLYHRSFKKRETSVRELAAKLFHHAKLSFPEQALWCQRVKLAAAVARLRIKYNALSLMDLLPSHLRGDRMNKDSKNIPVTVWINNRKFKNGNDIKKQIEHVLKVKLVDELKDLGPNTFKWDRHCPLTVAFHYSMRTQLAKSNLVRGHKLIVQDRSFCVGAATFWKVVEDLELSGSVIQTHVNSPRSTAYLANLLSQNEKIKKLMAFSAGRRKIEYENYLHELGMTNVVVYSDKLVDFGFESPCMEEVVAVYATPPNSYSAVKDPIDLVCSRGGDLSMLEILTESEDTLEGRNRVTKILEEQRKTLKFAMSRPQIQVVLYETHSQLDVENCEMVKTTLNEINRIAKLHHASLQGLISSDYMSSLQMPSEWLKEINNNEEEKREESDENRKDDFNSGDDNSGINTTNSIDDQSETPCDLKNVHVPDTDLFDTPDLPCLCPEETNCKMENGCYLALIKRKQVLKLDNKYMIQMAEQRGLFGSNNSNTSKQKGTKQNRKKQNLKQEPKQKRARRRLKDFEEITETELSPESPQSIWRTDGAEIELEITTTENKENEYIIKVTSKTEAGTISGNLTNSQQETIHLPSHKLSCQSCSAIPRQLSEEMILSELDQNVTKKTDTIDKPLHPRTPSLESEILSNSSDSTKENIFEDLSGDPFVAYKKGICSRPISRCATIPEDSQEEIHEIKSIASFEIDSKCDKQTSAMNIGKKEKNRKKKGSLKKIEKRTKHTRNQLIEDENIGITEANISRPSSASSGYEIIVKPSGTFNINAGPVRIFKYGLDLRNIKGELTEEIVNRISIPTVSSKIRSLKKEGFPTYRRRFDGNVSSELTFCECCKRRNSN